MHTSLFTICILFSEGRKKEKIFHHLNCHSTGSTWLNAGSRQEEQSQLLSITFSTCSFKHLVLFFSRQTGLKLTMTLKSALCPSLLGWEGSKAYSSHYRQPLHSSYYSAKKSTSLVKLHAPILEG